MTYDRRKASELPSSWNLIPVHRAYEQFLSRVRRHNFTQREVEHDLKALISWSEIALKSVKAHPVLKEAKD